MSTSDKSSDKLIKIKINPLYSTNTSTISNIILIKTYESIPIICSLNTSISNN